jgi:hypothetical protein
MNSVQSSILVIILVLLISASAHSQEVARDVWIDKMSTVLPAAFCMAGQYFRECFDVSQIECEETPHSLLPGFASKNIRSKFQKSSYNLRMEVIGEKSSAAVLAKHMR